MSGNPLVAGPTPTSALAGAGLLDDLTSTAQAIENRDWLGAALSGFASGMDVVAAVMDPIGTLIAWGAGWLLDHVDPLKTWLNKLTGDAGAVGGFAQTWVNIATRLSEEATNLSQQVSSQLAGMSGAAIEAYYAHAGGLVNATGVVSRAAASVAGGVQIAAMVVQVVHELVRDALAQIIGGLASAIIQAVCSLGTLIPKVCADVSARVAAVSGRVGKTVNAVVEAFTTLKGLVKKLGDKLDELAGLFRKGDDLPTGKPKTPDAPGGTPKTPDSPAPRGPNGPKDGVNDPNAPKGPGETPSCNDPVDAATGRVFMPLTDLTLPGALPVQLGRMFSSTFGGGRWFGRTWASSFDEYLLLEPGRVVYVRPDAGLMGYAAPELGGPATLPWAGIRRWPLTHTAEGWQLTDPVAGVTRLFHESVHEPGTAELVSVTDRAGRWTRIERTPTGAPLRVHTSGGYQVHVDTDSLDTPTGPAGRVTGLSVLDRGTLVPVIRFGYTGGLLTHQWRGDWPTPTRFEYDPGQRLTAWVDTNDLRYDYVYDDRHRCISQGSPDGTLAAAYDYSGHDQTTGHRVTVMTDALGHQWRYLVDAAGNVAAEIDPLGNATTHDYDPWGNRTTTTDPLGHSTRTVFDEWGRPVLLGDAAGRLTRLTWGDSASPTAVRSPDGSMWHYGHDARGQLLESTNPLGAVSRYEYSADGRRVGFVDATGQRTVIECDAAGLLLVVDEPGEGVTEWQRDGFGRVVQHVDAAGTRTCFAYDSSGHLARRSRPGRDATWEYDGEGNLVREVDEEGRVRTYEVGAFDVVTRRTDPTGASISGEHDPLRRLTALVDSTGNRWTYTYDASGRLVGEEDWFGRSTTYLRDAAGRVVRSIGADGSWISSAYDALGQLVSTTSSSGETCTYDYDPRGQLILAANSGSRVTRSYDPLGQLLAEDVNGAVTRYGYDALGRRTERTTPGNVQSHWHFEPHERTLHFGPHRIALSADPTQGLSVRRYDDQLRVSRRTAPDTVELQVTADGVPAFTSWTALNAVGDVTETGDSRFGRTSFELDGAGRVVGVTRPHFAEEYRYDSRGAITTSSWDAQRSPAASGLREFDSGRLTRAGRDRLLYDAAGRVVTRQRRTLSGQIRRWEYAWDAADRLVQVTTPDGQLWRYDYDALGRRLRKRTRGADGTETVYLFTWDGPLVIEQSCVSGAERAQLSWEYDGWTPLAQYQRTHGEGRSDEDFLAIITDLVGAPTELLTLDGTTAWRRRSNLWGAATLDWGPFDVANTATTPLRMPGQYHDDESGLHYNVLRYYDPELGRYLSPDPLGAGPADDPYAYPSRPLVEADPLGLAPCKRNLSDPNPVPRNYREAYEDIRAGNGTPRVDANGNPKVFQGRENSKWAGAIEYEVPGVPGGRVLVKTLPDGRLVMGYNVLKPGRGHYDIIKPFTAPHYPDAGW